MVDKIDEGLVVGQKVRVTNPKANPKHTVLALSKGHVKVFNNNSKRAMKFKRDRIERVNGISEDTVDEANSQLSKILAHRAATAGTGVNRSAEAKKERIAAAPVNNKARRVANYLVQVYGKKGAGRLASGDLKAHIGRMTRKEETMADNEETIVENEIAVDNDYIADAIEAMLSGNRIRFGDAMNAIMQAKATEVVNARREELAQTMFNASDEVEEEEVEEVDETEAPEEETEESTEE